jgi:hypothetical protein
MFTQQQYGVEGVARVMAELSAADRALLSDVQAIGWYPVEPILRYHHALDRVFGSGDLALCTAAGRFSATWSMNTILKVFVRFKSPLWLVDKATRVWSRYHDTGRWEVSTTGPHGVHGELLEYQVRDEAFCARLRGWLQGAIEGGGGKRAQVVETRCACHRADRCVFELSWQD